MSNYDSNGEVYGTKALTLAIIAASAMILMGVVYTPGQAPAQTRAQSTIEQVVVAAPAANSKAAG